jgi:hypothetical protein
MWSVPPLLAGPQTHQPNTGEGLAQEPALEGKLRSHEASVVNEAENRQLEGESVQGTIHQFPQSRAPSEQGSGCGTVDEVLDHALSSARMGAVMMCLVDISVVFSGHGKH